MTIFGSTLYVAAICDLEQLSLLPTSHVTPISATNYDSLVTYSCFQTPAFSTYNSVFKLVSTMRAGQLKSEWLRAEEIVQHVELGDLLEISRVTYEHWAVYIGSLAGLPFVIHLSSGKTGFSSGWSSGPAQAAKAQVRRDPLMVVVGKDWVRINNAFDAYRQPFPPKKVVERATQELGREDYDLLLNNCEHFARWCRYGRRTSVQANAALITLPLNPILLVGVSVAGCARLIRSVFKMISRD